MKFRFKIQQYQTDAVDSVVRVFRGQPYSNGISYVRDLGEQQPVTTAKQEQMTMFPDPQLSFDDLVAVSYTHLDVYKRQLSGW